MQWFIEQGHWPLLAACAYLVILNAIGFLTAFSDKRKAVKGKWRTPERRFLFLAAIGGGAGVLLGFFAFRHKTRHGRLLFGVAALSACFYGAVIAVRFLLS